MKRTIDLSLLHLLENPVPAHVFELHRTLTHHGFQCHLVGGCVRDLLLGLKVQDVDVTTDARPEDVIRIFKRTVPTGLQHGTVTVLLDGHPYEITTYRTESDYTDGRRPDRIQYAATLEEDLSRRDFTINALALNPATGELTDEFEGEDDLRKGVIRTIGRPEERFFEDGLRPVRACRFRATLRFRIDQATQEAMKRDDVRVRMKGVAIERFADELWKGLKAKNPAPMFEALQEADLLSIFLPCLRTLPFSFFRSLQMVRDPILRMALWLDRTTGGFRSTENSQGMESCAKHLRLSGAITKRIVLYGSLFRQLESMVLDSAAPATSDLVAWRKLLGRVKKELHQAEDRADFLAAAAAFIVRSATPWQPGTASDDGAEQETIQDVESDEHSATSPKQGLGALPLLKSHFEWMQHSLSSEPLIITDLALHGKDLQAMGYSGPALGAVLQFLLDQVLEDPKRNTVETLISSIDNLRPTTQM